MPPVAFAPRYLAVTVGYMSVGILPATPTKQDKTLYVGLGHGGRNAGPRAGRDGKSKKTCIAAAL